MNDNAIGIFDSGIGGLTIAHAIKKNLPKESIIYFGDTKHLPYGEKSEKSIEEFSKLITKFLLEKKCKAIIIACNTASCIAYEKVKEICGEIPVFNVIDPIIEEININFRKSNIGIIGTKATINSRIYDKKIKSKNKNQIVSSLATPLLAAMIEEGFFDEKISKTIVKNYLDSPKLKNINTLVLACTHYPLIKKEISKYYNGSVEIIDTANIIGKSISKELNKLNLYKNNNYANYEFYVSNYTKSFEKSAQLFFKEKIKLKELNLNL